MDLVPIEDRIPLPLNASAEDILSLLFRIYRKPYITEVVVRSKEVVVRRRGVEGDPIVDTDGREPHDVINSVEMEEVESKDPHKTLFTMFFRLSATGLEVSHIFVGSTQKLRRWLGLPEMVSLGGRLFGARVTREGTLPDDVLLVCGSAHRDMDVGGIQRIIKVTMLEEVEREAVAGKGVGDGNSARGNSGASGEVGVEWGLPGGAEEGPHQVSGGN